MEHSLLGPAEGTWDQGLVPELCKRPRLPIQLLARNRISLLHLEEKLFGLQPAVLLGNLLRGQPGGGPQEEVGTQLEQLAENPGVALHGSDVDEGILPARRPGIHRLETDAKETVDNISPCRLILLVLGLPHFVK